MPYPNSPPKRGDIYQVDFNPARGSEQAGRRPAVVITLDSFNIRMPVVVVAAITTKIKPFSFTVDLPQGQPLGEHSQILAFQVTTVDKARLESYLGCLNGDQIEKLKAALRIAWGLESRAEAAPQSQPIPQGTLGQIAEAARQGQPAAPPQ